MKNWIKNVLGISFTGLLFVGGLFAIAYTTIMFIGCAAVAPLPTICDKAPAESIICPKLAEIGIQIEDIDLLMKIAFERLAEKENIEIINKYKKILLDMLETSPAETIFSYWTGITEELTAPEILLLNRYLSVLSVDRVLCDFDQELIKKLLL